MSDYKGVIWYLGPGCTTSLGVMGPLWYRISHGVVQRCDEEEMFWSRSAAYADDVEAFLRERLPIVNGVGVTNDEDLTMDEGL